MLMTITRRVCLAGALALGLIPIAAAQTGWPARPIKILVPYAAGGNSDVVARIAGQYLQESLGVAVVIENRTGAGGLVATEAVARAAPDGYTLLLGAIGPLTIAPATQTIAYDPVRDFAPVAVISTNPLMLVVHPSVKATSVRELIALAHAQPKALNFGSAGEGGLTHFSAELFKAMAGIDMVHVPYRGGAPATNALLAGEVQVEFANYSDVLPHITAGGVRALGITTATRAAQSPDVPTIAEAGLPGYACESWNGILAPRGTPDAVVERLARALDAMARDPATQKRMIEVGSIAVSTTPQAFARMIAVEGERWSKLVKQAGIKLQ
jgi:tripartite-type tricarboxylate transporter receptor subunit TctC